MRHMDTLFWLLWPWPWPDDLDIRTWPKDVDSEGVPAY